jgi:N-acetylglucosamine-6-phosphate deacetylase
MTTVAGRLVLDDSVVDGLLAVENGIISEVNLDADSGTAGPYIAPGFVDLHVHGWGGHDAMGGPAALDGMARALARRGVTSFLPTAVSAPIDSLALFADSVRDWMPSAPGDGAQPLGFNLEGPFLAESRRGAHDPASLLTPDDVAVERLSPLIESLRLITVAPELAGATELIAWLSERGVAVSLGHSGATFVQAGAGFAAGATSSTHLFNAMSGVDHRVPGLAVAALLDDDVYAELIADGIHVDVELWPIVTRLKPTDRLMLVSDAIALAGTGSASGRIGILDVQVEGARVTLAGTSTLAGSVLSLDVAVRNLVLAGVPLTNAVAAASRNPLSLLGITDRGRIAVGQRADLVELDSDLMITRAMRSGTWLTEVQP